MAPRVTLVEDTPTQKRVTRRPAHKFQVKHRPWAIQPFLLAPVLPGETMDNLLLQSRVVTDPVSHPLLGWWVEYYFFYVKHRDLDDRDTLTSMALTGASTAGMNTAALVDTYHYAGSIDWANKCLKRVTEEYFRNTGEAWDAYKIGNLPAAVAQTDGLGIWDSVIDDATSAPAANPLQEGDDLTIMSGYQQHYDRMRQARLTDLSYDDFLKTYGVRGVKESEDLHIPELLRYVREWSYPTNTVDPVSGTPTSAVSWSIAERADKPRLFKEPGFVFGVTVVRPKIYLRNQRGTGSHGLDNAQAWLPALISDEPYTSLKLFDATASTVGPLGVNTASGYWVDMRDLFVHGDQFVNFAMAAGDGSVPLPTAGLQSRFLTSAANDADINAFFKSATANTVRQDGVVNLSVRTSARFGRDFT